MDATWRLQRHLAEQIRKQWPHGPACLLAAVSGGADSICLLHLLSSLAESQGFRLVCCHVHHGIRGAAADADQEFVAACCRQLGVPLQAISADAPALARMQGLSLEEAARRVRHEALRRVAEEEGADAVVLAHHRDDQAETVLLHLLRGAGSEGLRGMLPWRDGLFRPLLDIPGAALRACLLENGWAWREDATNEDVVHRRNALRHQVLPWLRERLGHDPAGPLARFAAIQQEDQALLAEWAERAARDAGLMDGSADEAQSAPGARFRSGGLSRLHPALARRVVFLAWQRATGSRNGLETVHAAAVSGLCEGRKPEARVSLPGGWQARLSGDWCVLEPVGPMPAAVPDETAPHSEEDRRAEESGTCAKYTHPAAWSHPVLWPEMVGASLSTPVPEAGGCLVVRRLTRDEALAAHPAGREAERGCVQLLDSSVPLGGILIRNRRDGDRFHPWRAPGGRRLKSWFIDRKVPAPARAGMPLLADGDRILWVIGHRTAETLTAGNGCGDVFELRWFPAAKRHPDVV